MTGYGTTIHTSTHNYNIHPMWAERVDRSIKVGKHVWIGTGAIILLGVIIEDYSVVGAGTVVTKRVPMGAIIAGNPAKIIRYRNKAVYTNCPIVDSRSGAKIIKKEKITRVYK